MGKQIQFTKKDAYHTPGKAKRERIKVTTIQKAHLLKKFSNVLRDNKDGISFWFNTERFMTTARRYNFVASSILRDIELSEYIEEDESVSLKTIRRLLNYCQYPEEEELMVGIQAIKHIGKALYGDEDALLEVIDEESLCCMAEQYLAQKSDTRRTVSHDKILHRTSVCAVSEPTCSISTGGRAYEKREHGSRRKNCKTREGAIWHSCNKKGQHIKSASDVPGSMAHVLLVRE